MKDHSSWAHILNRTRCCNCCLSLQWVLEMKAQQKDLPSKKGCGGKPTEDRAKTIPMPHWSCIQHQAATLLTPYFQSAIFWTTHKDRPIAGPTLSCYHPFWKINKGVSTLKNQCTAALNQNAVLPSSALTRLPPTAPRRQGFTFSFM